MLRTIRASAPRASTSHLKHAPVGGQDGPRSDEPGEPGEEDCGPEEIRRQLKDQREGTVLSALRQRISKSLASARRRPTVQGKGRATHWRLFGMRSAKEDKIWRSFVMKRLLPKASSFVLHPHNPSVRNWNLLVALVLLVEAPLLPLQLAFIPDGRLVQLPWLLWFRCWAELVFWLDMALQFFLEVQPDCRTHWVSDLRTIAVMYLSNGFAFDMCSVAPIKGLLAALWPPECGVCFVTLVGFHRLLRFARLPRALNSMQAHCSKVVLQCKYSVKRLGRATALVLFAAHVMGCLWASLAVCGSEDFTWYQFWGKENPGNGLYTEGEPVVVYMCALYWAVFTLTGIGYGDVVPFSPPEYVVATLCMLAASLIWAWVVANIVSIIATMKHSSTSHFHTIDYVNELLRDNAVEANLGRRLREYFMKTKEVKEQDFLNNTIDELSPELRIEVVYAVHGHWIEKVWWLKNLPPHSEFVVELAQNLKATLHTPSEIIPNRPELTIIRRGLCIRGGLLMTTGHVYGEDLLLNNEALRKPYITLVLTFLHTLSIPKPLFEQVLSRHPEAAPHIRKAFVIFAVMRGLLYRADMYRSAQKRRYDAPLLEVAAKSFYPSDYGSQRSSSVFADCEGSSELQRARLTKRWSNQSLNAAPESSLRKRVVEAELSSLSEQVSKVEARLRARVQGLEDLAARLTEQVRLLTTS